MNWGEGPSNWAVSAPLGADSKRSFTPSSDKLAAIPLLLDGVVADDPKSRHNARALANLCGLTLEIH